MVTRAWVLETLRAKGYTPGEERWPDSEFGFVIDYEGKTHKARIHIEKPNGGWLKVEAHSYIHPRDPRRSHLSTDALMGLFRQVGGIGIRGYGVGPLNARVYMWNNRGHLADDEVSEERLWGLIEAVCAAQKTGFELVEKELDATGEPR